MIEEPEDDGARPDVPEPMADKPKVRERNFRNLPEEENLLRLLRCTQAACEAVIDAHNADTMDNDCPCGVCGDVAGFRWPLGIIENMLTCCMHPMAEDRA